jgi:predicted nucleic acid-binding protein
MSGELVCVDTNIIVYTLAGRQDLSDKVRGKTIVLSVIAEIEALSYPDLTDKDRQMVCTYIERCTVIGIGERVKHETIRLRSSHKLKLPDAIIAATALVLDATLLTTDKGFLRLGGSIKLDLADPIAP